MATKSIGTLAAKLLVDTTGWFAGFKKADKQALSFTQRTEQRFKEFSRAFGRTALLGGGLFTAKRAADAFANSLARVEKSAGLLDASKDAAQAAAAVERMGLAISKIDGEKMAGLIQKLRETQAVLVAIGDNLVSQLTPAVDNFLSQWLIGVELIIKRYQDLGAISKAVIEGAVVPWWMDPKKVNTALGIIPAAESHITKTFNAILEDLGLKTPTKNGPAPSVAAIAKGMKDQARDAEKFRTNARNAAPPAAVEPVGAAKPGAGPRPLSGTQQPFERGTTAAAVAVLEMKGNPIHSVAKNTADMLTELKAIREEARKQDRQQRVGVARINK